MRSLLMVLLVWGTAVLGCRSSKPVGGATEPAGAIREPRPLPGARNVNLPRVTPVSHHSGKIVSVNGPLRFVVVDFYLSTMPPLEQRMNVYRQGQKVGEIKITGPSESKNIAADILAGEARVGDEARVD